MTAESFFHSLFEIINYQEEFLKNNATLEKMAYKAPPSLDEHHLKFIDFQDFIKQQNKQTTTENNFQFYDDANDTEEENNDVNKTPEEVLETEEEKMTKIFSRFMEGKYQLNETFSFHNFTITMEDFIEFIGNCSKDAEISETISNHLKRLGYKEEISLRPFKQALDKETP